MEKSFFYYIINRDKNKTDIEKVFIDAFFKINLLKRHYKKTVNLYLEDRQKEFQNVTKIYQEELDSLRKKNQEILNSINNQEGIIEKNLIAREESGLGHLESEIVRDEYYIKEKYDEYFDLLSKSTLVNMHSIFEVFFMDICKKIGSKICNLQLNDLKGNDYILKSIKYLSVVTDINFSSLNSNISKHKKIQLIRNKIIHQDSIFDSDEIKNIRDLETSGFIELSENKLKLPNVKLVIYAVDNFIELIKKTFFLIDEKMEFIMTSRMIKLLFGLKFEITSIDFKDVSHSKITFKVCFDICTSGKSVDSAEGIISFRKSKTENEIECLNETKDEKIEMFLYEITQNKKIIFDIIISPVFLHYPFTKLNIRLY